MAAKTRRDRRRGIAREGCGAADRHAPAREDRRAAQYARDDDARFRLLRAAQRARAKARRVQADLFVSIHADAFPVARGARASVFALSERGASARPRAGWPTRKTMPTDRRCQYGQQGCPGGARAARLVHNGADQRQHAGRQVRAAEIGGINKLHKGSVEQAGFAVLKAPDIPSILIETAFISNPEEERKLNDDSHQEQLANAILRGIKAYFARNPPLSKNPSV
jgi:N-acetylmuramoyl-L-alanine amidase